MRPLRFLISILIITMSALLFKACKSTEPTGQKALIETFTKGSKDLNTKYKAHHESEDSTRFFIKINTENLLYQKNSAGEQQASVIIKFSPISLGDTPHDLPPKSIRIVDVDDTSENKILLGSTLMKIPAGADYEINATVTDENRQQSYTTGFFCAKSDHRMRQNFLVANVDLNNPIFTDRITPQTNYIIGTGATENQELIVRYYKRDFPRPLPPFVQFDPPPFDYTADSMFTLILDEQNQTNFTSASGGFYHFQTDTASKEGLSLFVSSDEYPEVKSIDNMIDPFRYLVGKRNYQKVIVAENKRSELENFWIEWSGSKDRARKAIEAYYSRIEQANRLFSSYIEGWKSDRGIVYAVYGKPNKVYYKNNAETWIYGEEQNPLSITFTFVQVINPFTNNDYRLIRDEIYKPSWYHSLNACRYGKS